MYLVGRSNTFLGIHFKDIILFIQRIIDEHIYVNIIYNCQYNHTLISPGEFVPESHPPYQNLQNSSLLYKMEYFHIIYAYPTVYFKSF